MQAPPLIALEVVLGFVVPIGWALYELFDLRRERERDRIKAQARLDAAADEAAGADQVAPPR